MLEITKSYTFKTIEGEDITFAEGAGGRVILRFEGEEGTLSYDQVVRLRSVILYDLAPEPKKEVEHAVPTVEAIPEPIKDDEIHF